MGQEGWRPGEGASSKRKFPLESLWMLRAPPGVEVPGVGRRKIFPTAQAHYSDTSDSLYTGPRVLI